MDASPIQIPQLPANRSRKHTPRKRIKTFSGCWTCRSRRLKCDERRPCCWRCENASLSCEGYGIRLNWRTSEFKGQPTGIRQESNTLHRSKLSADSFPSCAILSSHAVNSIQKDLNLLGVRQSDSSIGPFAVFSGFEPTNNLSIHGTPSSNHPSSEPETPASCSNHIIMLNRLPSNGDDRYTQEDFDLPLAENREITTAEAMHTSLSHTSSVEICANLDQLDGEAQFYSEMCHPDQRGTGVVSADIYLTPTTSIICSTMSNLATFDDSNIRDYGRISSINGETGLLNMSEPQPKHYRRLNGTQPPIGLHIDLLHAPWNQRELIHHWVTSLSVSMVPVDTIYNPYRTIFMRLALAGLNSSSDEFNGEVAVFHGICSASAYHISRLHGISPHYHTLAQKHRQVALYNLRRTLQGENCIKRDAVFIAILTFLCQDGIRGSCHEWRDHTKGLTSLIQSHARNSPGEDTVMRSIYTSYLCIVILGNIVTPVDLSALFSRIPAYLPEFQYTRGVTRSLLEKIMTINNIAQSPSSYGQVYLDRFELELYLHIPQVVKTDSISDRIAQILQHHANIYYYATIVHFQRVVRRKGPAEVEHFVEKALQHFEAIEEPKDKDRGCIWVWPCLVISAECQTPELQDRMTKWYEVNQQHGFKNSGIACSIAKKVWKKRSSYGGDIGDIYWQDCMRGTDDAIPL